MIAGFPLKPMVLSFRVFGGTPALDLVNYSSMNPAWMENYPPARYPSRRAATFSLQDFAALKKCLPLPGLLKSAG